MEKERIIEQYLETFGELPPADMMINFYDDFYIDLMKEAVESKKKITAETIENAIGNRPYDYIGRKQFDNFKKGE